MTDAGKWDELFYRTPGAQYGNPPEGQYPGRIVIDPAEAVQAIRRLARRVEVVRVEPAANGEGLLAVVFRWREPRPRMSPGGTRALAAAVLR